MVDDYRLTVLSQIVGWTYFTLWSISFYFQIHQNWSLKKLEILLIFHPSHLNSPFFSKFSFSVKGFSVKFQLINFTGFGMYAIYNTIGYFWESSSVGIVIIPIHGINKQS